MMITARKREPTAMFVLLVWTVFLSQVCVGLCPTRLPSMTSLSSLSSSSSLMMASRLGGKKKIQTADDPSDSGEISRLRQRDREARTLYDYLGASPKDTQEQLKIRYTTLAKKLHPDSNPDGNTATFYYDLSEINAAWEVLKDPEERKRYDRSLQTKEITEGIESIVNKGLESFATNAIPFLQKTAVSTAAAMQKTAVTTAAAVDASTKAAKEVNEQANRAYGAFEIEQQIKILEQKSSADSLRASKLQKELVALPAKKIGSLEKKQQQRQQQQQQPLSSVEAQRILRNFQTTVSAIKPPPTSLTNEIKLLADTESKHRDAIRACQSTERNTQLADRKSEQALKAEEMAQKRLEEAQMALKLAKKNNAVAQEEDRKAKTEERMAQQSSAKIETMLQKTREKIRVGLLQQQDAFIVYKTNELKKEKIECEKLSEKYKKEVKTLKIAAKKAGKKL